MKILHYVDESYLAWARPWMQLIIALEKNGFANTVLCPPGGTLSGFLKEHSVPAIYASAPLPWLPPLCRDVGQAIKRAAPDIIHTRLSSAARIGGYWGKKLAVSVISTIDKYPKLKYYKNTQVAVGCSTAVTSHMIEAGFPEEQTVTIHNPVDGDFYRFNQDERESFRAKAGIRPEEIVFLGLGRFIEWKAFDLLIEACSSIKHLPGWRLWLVGDGPDRHKLESMVDRLSLRDKTTFWGFATDIRPFLWASDLFIQPSDKPEGFSLAILEAMAAGLPAAATTIGGTLDLLDGGGLFPFEVGDGEALVAILKNFISLPREGRQKMEDEAVKSASRFYLDSIAAKYGELYKKVFFSESGMIDGGNMRFRQ